MNIETLYQLYLKNPSISTDSRTVKSGDLFFALSGEHFNGNKFAKEALKKGAKYAIIDNKDYQWSENYFLVNDVLETLQHLATYHRQQLNIPIIAITGTNGKTTTKELVHSVLQSSFQTTATVGNFNNHIGVPLTLLRMNKNTEIGVIEMGANHPNEIQFLCNIAQPNIGIITNVGMAHLEGFKDFAGVRKTKKELYDVVKQHKGKIIINGEDEFLREMLGDYPAFSFGKNDNSNLIIKNIKSNPNLIFDWETAETASAFSLQTHLIGEYHLANVASAIAVGLLFDISPQKINQAIENYVPSNNRSQVVETKKHNKIWLDAYNANPTSMTAAITHFSKIQENNKFLIIGEMLELGEYSKQEHQKIINLIKKCGFSNVFLVGESFESFASEFPYFENTDLLEDELKLKPLTYQSILIKGSRKNHLETIVQYL